MHTVTLTLTQDEYELFNSTLSEIDYWRTIERPTTPAQELALRLAEALYDADDRISFDDAPPLNGTTALRAGEV